MIISLFDIYTFIGFLVIIGLDMLIQLYGTGLIYRKYAGYSLDKRGFALRRVFAFVFLYNCGIVVSGVFLNWMASYLWGVDISGVVTLMCMVLVFINVLSIMRLDPMLNSKPTDEERYFYSKNYFEFCDLCTSYEDYIIEANKEKAAKIEKRFKEFCSEEDLQSEDDSCTLYEDDAIGANKEKAAKIEKCFKEFCSEEDLQSEDDSCTLYEDWKSEYGVFTSYEDWQSGYGVSILYEDYKLEANKEKAAKIEKRFKEFCSEEDLQSEDDSCILYEDWESECASRILYEDWKSEYDVCISYEDWQSEYDVSILYEDYKLEANKEKAAKIEKCFKEFCSEEDLQSEDDSCILYEDGKSEYDD